MNSSASFLFFLSFLFFSYSTDSKAQTNQWSRFRGTDGTGADLSGNAPVTWKDTDYRWKITLPGKGNTTPVVWGNTIFVTSGEVEMHIGHAFAINGVDGKILWQKEFRVTDLKMHVDNTMATASPAVDATQVYFIWYSKEKTTLTALAHDGTFRWEANFGGIESRHGGGSSLMLTDKYVVFTREQEDSSSQKSSWVAVNKLTGKTAWELKRESAIANSFSTPLLVKTENHSEQLIFSSQAHGLTGLNPENGQVMWELKEIFPARAIASPIYSNGMIVACRKGGAVVFDFNPKAIEPKAAVRYSLPVNLSPYVPTPIVVGELLYLFMDSGMVACVKLATGELLWKERPAGPIFGSPICVGGILYCITKEGKVLAIRAGLPYQLLGISELGEGSFSTPVTSESGMVFRTFSQLMSLRGEKSK
jgi:outer membrane protein assembly factor BamB